MHSVWLLWFVICVSYFVCYENPDEKNGGPLEPTNQSKYRKTMLKVHLVASFVFFSFTPTQIYK